jgi:2-oxoglutarate dehydrogenase E1 component
MIDQYLVKTNGTIKTVVLLLPHGYEGQGAEHSSARMERYLQLCARHNMYVADCTTPANFFTCCEQMKTTFRKPLVVFTQSLLRDPRCVSVELATGSFQETIDDTTVNKADVKTLVFCTGKFYLTLP